MAPPAKHVGKPLSGFPTWDGDYAAEMTGEQGCPVSLAEMAEYMRNCHYRYCLDEEPTEFQGFVLREHLFFTDRNFWVWSCADGCGRVWDIIVGRGRTPIYGQTGNHLWMHGERNPTLHAPRDLVAREFPEHDTAIGRAH